MGGIHVLKKHEYDKWVGNFGYVVKYKKSNGIFDSVENHDMREEIMSKAVLSYYLGSSFNAIIYSANRVIIKDYLKEHPDIKINVWKGSM